MFAHRLTVPSIDQEKHEVTERGVYFRKRKDHPIAVSTFD